MIMETKVRLAIVECGQALGVQQLMSKQLEALDAFLNGRDTFVLPIGYKSLSVTQSCHWCLTS